MLKPCPFCGCEQILMVDTADGYFYAHCSRCEVRTCDARYEHVAEKDWNRRATPPTEKWKKEFFEGICSLNQDPDTVNKPKPRRKK